MPFKFHNSDGSVCISLNLVKLGSGTMLEPDFGEQDLCSEADFLKKDYLFRSNLGDWIVPSFPGFNFGLAAESGFFCS